MEWILVIAGLCVALPALGRLAEGWLFQQTAEQALDMDGSASSEGESDAGALPPGSPFVAFLAPFWNGAGVRILGKFEIPRLEKSLLVVEGVNDNALRLGIGHVPGTSPPGERGNVALAAHRDTFFRSLRELQVGDRIVLRVHDKPRSYLIQEERVVPPDDVSVLRQSTEDRITLITCYPFGYIGNAPNRFVVTGSSDTAP